MSSEGFTLRGAERVYRLDCSGVNALARIEEATGLWFDDLITALQGECPDPQLILAFLGASLIDPVDASPEEVAAILEDIGGPVVVIAAAEAL